MDYKIINTAEDISKALSKLKEVGAVGLDIETTSLSPRDGKIRLIQLSDGDDLNYIIDVRHLENPKSLKLLIPFLVADRPRKVIHNGKFEELWFQEVLGCEINGVFDTYIASRMLDTKMKAKLDEVTLKFLGVELDKEEQKGNWDVDALTKSQLEYAIRDAYYLPHLRKKLIEEIFKHDMVETAEIEFRCTPAIAHMEYVGFPLNVELHQTLIDAITIRRDARKEDLESILNVAMGKKVITTIQDGLFGDTTVTENGGINLNSPKQVLEAFHKLGVEIPSTGKDVITTSMVKKYPQLEYLTRYRAEQILLTSFGEKLIRMINPKTGRIHPTFWQLLTETARFSCSTPNLQQIPHSKEFRECWMPSDPDNVFVIADYAGMELRILAQMSQDTVMINAFKNKIDLHSLTAKGAFNLSCDVADIATKFPTQRSFAKQLNFGIVYGIGAQKYSERVNIPQSEAQTAINGFYKTYQGAKKYLYGIEDIGVAQRYVRSVSNRKMPLYFNNAIKFEVSQARRNARNYPIQSSCADILKVAVAQLHHELKDYRADLVNIIHDEIVLECHKDDAPQVAYILETTMINAAKRFLPDVEIEAEAKICTNWSEK